VSSLIDNARAIIYILAKAWIINYNSRIKIYCFIVMATVIMIVNYNCTVMMIVNYNHKTFIVQATDLIYDSKTKAGIEP